MWFGDGDLNILFNDDATILFLSLFLIQFIANFSSTSVTFALNDILLLLWSNDSITVCREIVAGMGGYDSFLRS